MFALQADAAFGRQFGEGSAEPFRNIGAIGVFLGGGPFRHVHIGGEFAIDPYFQLFALGLNGHVVPLAGFLDHLFGRGQMAEDAAGMPSGSERGAKGRTRHKGGQQGKAVDFHGGSKIDEDATDTPMHMSKFQAFWPSLQS